VLDCTIMYSIEYMLYLSNNLHDFMYQKTEVICTALRTSDFTWCTRGSDDGPCILSSYTWMFTDPLFLRDPGSVPGCFG